MKKHLEYVMVFAN